MARCHPEPQHKAGMTSPLHGICLNIRRDMMWQVGRDMTWEAGRALKGYRLAIFQSPGDDSITCGRTVPRICCTTVLPPVSCCHESACSHLLSCPLKSLTSANFALA